MCDLPGCPNNGSEPIELTDENRAYMRVEASSAALHMLTLFARGWNNAANGVLEDISDKWGFIGITRTVYVLTQGIAILPAPEDSPLLQRATPDTIRARLREATGDSFAEHVALQMISFGDQVHAALKEIIALAGQGPAHEEKFNTRFDEITDAENMLQPLVQSVLMQATVVYVAAMRDKNTSALDQYQAACRAGLDLGKHDEAAAKEVEDLTALLHFGEDDKD